MIREASLRSLSFFDINSSRIYSNAVHHSEGIKIFVSLVVVHVDVRWAIYSFPVLSKRQKTQLLFREKPKHRGELKSVAVLSGPGYFFPD